MNVFKLGQVRGALRGMSVAIALASLTGGAQAQDAAGRQLGTVKAVNGSSLTVQTDAGKTMTVTVGADARIQQLAPGSTDTKTAQPSTADQIATGDRILAIGATAGDTLTATRVILMKSSAIEQRNQTSQMDWQRRGSGGIVSSVDATAGTIALKAGAKTVTVSTTGSTMYRRYAPGSVRFEDAKAGTLADVHAGDQLRVRGDKNDDGSTVKAEEVVSGSFRNLSGTIVSVDAANQTVVLKDLTTKKNETVKVSDASDLRALPTQMAAMVAARNRAASAGGVEAAATTAGAGGAGRRPAGAGTPDAATSGARPEGTATARTGAGGGGDRAQGGLGGQGGGAGRTPGAGGFGARGGAGGGGADLAQMITRAPKTTLAQLKAGDALMIVASGSGASLTAITLVSGVEPILTAPNAAEMTISPWSLGGGGGEGGGEGGMQ